MIVGLKSKIRKLNAFQIVVICHGLLSFFYENVLFTFSEKNFAIFQQVAISDYISDKTEMTLMYILTKGIGFVLIYFFWKAIFWAVEEIRVRKEYTFFILLFLVGIIFGLFMYPSTFGLEMDNFANYLYATHYLPTYWQSVFTGLLYGGCMMVIPHAFAVFIFQWLAFFFVLMQIYMFVKNRYGKGVEILLFFFFLPESINLMLNAYRNNLYTILCLYYFLLLFRLGYEETEVAVKLKEIPKLIFLTAFVMTWRSEGLVIGFAGLVYVILFVYWKKVKEILKLVVGCIVVFLLLSKVQGIGEEKYFGSDYMILNTTEVLCSIFNNPDAILDYPGAEGDMDAIEKIVSVQALREAGIDGYRNHQWTEGRVDFNQSLATKEEAKGYLSAYARIMIYNINDYMNVQINHFFESMQFEPLYTTYSYEGEPSEDIKQYDYDFWKVGREAFRESSFTASWENNGLRNLVYKGLWKIYEVWCGIWELTGITVALHGASFMAVFYIFLYEFLQLCMKKDVFAIKRGIPFLVILGVYVLLLLVMPEGREAYVYSMLYCSYLMIYLYCLETKFSNRY